MDAPFPPSAGIPELEPAIRSRVRLGIVVAAPVTIAPCGPELAEEMETLSETLAGRYRGLAPSRIERLNEARRLYKSFGIDPTRTRPSSEALLRRVLRGKPLPRVSNAVDLANRCSLDFLLPLGLYDSGKIEPPLRLRRGLPGESYAGIRKDEVHLDGRPVLADRLGPFGNPTSDSLRASVDERTRSLLMIVFATASYPRERMEGHVDLAAGLMARHLASRETDVSTSTAVVP